MISKAQIYYKKAELNIKIEIIIFKWLNIKIIN